MELREFVAATIQNYLNEQSILKEGWYHGTPDAREVEKIGGFEHRTMSVEYVIDPPAFKDLQRKMTEARENGDNDLYHKLIAQVPNLRKNFTYKKPLFLSDKYSVAKTYADPKRAFDYQNSIEKVYEVDVDCNRNVKIIATGDRFRFISVEKVKRGFISAGVSEEEIDKLISMFNFYVSDNSGIKTDVIAAIGNWLEFDCIDVVGVLDSHQGGNVQSTVRMVLNPTKVRIKR